MDRLLESHPNHRLERWIEHARKQGSTEQEKMQYEKNARRIVTIWGPPVDDYSARIWSGLIRSYYLPRWQHYFQSLRTRQPFDFKTWELQWVANPDNIGPRRPAKDVVKTCARLLHHCQSITE